MAATSLQVGGWGTGRDSQPQAQAQAPGPEEEAQEWACMALEDTGVAGGVTVWKGLLRK